MPDDQRSSSRRFLRYPINAVFGVVLYALSSGPMFGLCFWLREVTGLQQFYAVMWFYMPIVHLRASGFPGLDKYISWWVIDVFRTAGPG